MVKHQGGWCWGCQRPEMHGHYVHRHDAAVELILEEINPTEQGGCGAWLMDAGKTADLPEGVGFANQVVRLALRKT